MQPKLAVTLSRFATGRYKPTTFLERGVAVPFTTPHLLGGRIRPGERRMPELVLANPAGSEGYYIMPWSALPEFCPPSLNDRAIWSRIDSLRMLTPHSVQGVARKVAAEGYAGRAAAVAANAAVANEERQRVLLHYHLLLELVRQGESPDSGLPPPERDAPANVERRARGVLEQRRHTNSLAPGVVVEALEELASAFDGTGLRNNPTSARLPLLCAEISAVMHQVAGWGDGGTVQSRQCTRLLIQAAEVTLRCARVALAKAQAQLDDIWTLAHRWRAAPDDVLGLVERGEWLLDGWREICAMWRVSQPETRLAAALDMASLLPMIPTEVGAWSGFDAAGEMDTACGGLLSWRRTVLADHDWQSGRLIERNESIRALTI